MEHQRQPPPRLRDAPLRAGRRALLRRVWGVVVGAGLATGDVAAGRGAAARGVSRPGAIAAAGARLAGRAGLGGAGVRQPGRLRRADGAGGRAGRTTAAGGRAAV